MTEKYCAYIIYQLSVQTRILFYHSDAAWDSSSYGCILGFCLNGLCYIVESGFLRDPFAMQLGQAGNLVSGFPPKPISCGVLRDRCCKVSW